MRIKTKIRLCHVAGLVLRICAFCCFVALVALAYLFAMEGFFSPLVELPRILATAAAAGGLLSSASALDWLDDKEFDLLTQQAEQAIDAFYANLYGGAR